MGTETCLSVRKVSAASSLLAMRSLDYITNHCHFMGTWWAPALCLKLSQRPRCWDRVSPELATTCHLFSPGGNVIRNPSFVIFYGKNKLSRCPYTNMVWLRVTGHEGSDFHDASESQISRFGRGSCAWPTGLNPFTFAKPAPLGRTTCMGSASYS